VIGSDVDQFLTHPGDYFGRSHTAMHSLERKHLEELQAAALTARFEQQRPRIAMLGRLADRQGITSVDRIEDVVPLLFEHTMYKSYPLALLERQMFDKLTDWLAKLTSADLSGTDATGCDSIASWLAALDVQADVEMSYTFGTSGLMGFLPWFRRDHEIYAEARRISHLQRFGEQPTWSVLDGPVHYISSPARWRHEYFADVLTGGQPGYVHLREGARSSPDLLWLAAQLRLAAARGDVSHVSVPAALLARRDELKAGQQRARWLDEAWIEEIAGLQGQFVLWCVLPHDAYSIAAPRLERGERWSFAPGSVALIAGGAKGHDLPADWRNTIERFLDLRVVTSYSMSELSGANVECERGRHHIPPWLVLFVLDPDTSRPLPRQGVQTGRAAFFDLLPEGHWGGLMTGDEVEVDFDSLCGCGAQSPHIAPRIERLATKRGGDDKITCAATPEAHAEAMQFLIDF